MNQLLLEKNLEMKFIPVTKKRNEIQKLYENPSGLAVKLAQETIKKITEK